MSRLALLVAILVGAIPCPAGGDCPTNTASDHGPGGSSTYVHSGPTWDQPVNGGHVAYDLVHGTFSVSSAGGGGQQVAGAELHVSDVYQIVGPISVSPIPFQVFVHALGNLSASLQSYPFIGTVCDHASASLNLDSAPLSKSIGWSAYSPTCTPLAVDYDLWLEMQKLPGEPFTVRYDLSVGSTAPGVVNCTFAFYGLPAGYSVTSCQGYSPAPTPVSNASWGSLKASYR